MESVLRKVEELALVHDKVDPKIVKEKNIKLGLRNEDGSGVFVGITSKGQVTGYEKIITGDGSEKVNPIPGKLYYCGYDVEDLVREKESEKRFGFEETIYLLLTGELPSIGDLRSFSKELGKRRALPEEMKEIILNRPRHDDQMCSLHTIVSAMHLFYKNPNSTDIRDVTRQCIDLIAKFPTIIAYNYKKKLMKKNAYNKLIEPDPDLSTSENFLYMLSGKVPDRFAAEMLDTMLIFHAEQ